jgi:hypothetical protein
VSAAGLQGSSSYIIILSAWIISAIFFSVLALRFSKGGADANDGCLLAIANVLMAFFGGAVGLLLLMKNYPWFLIASPLGAVIFPAVNTAVFLKKKRG